MEKIPSISHVASVLPVQNISEMTSFYSTKLGFKIEFTWEDPPSYVVLPRDSFKIHLAQSDSSTKKGQRRPFAFVFVMDVDELYKELTGRGVTEISTPENADYGMRDFELTDPENNVIIFGKGV